MNRKKVCLCTCVIAGFAVVSSITIAQQAKETKKGQADSGGMQLPPGWTEADMQACMLAGTPGEMHAYLNKDVGVWQGTNTMWMGPGTEPVKSDCSATIKPLMEGRFITCDVSGEMPEMGPFSGFGIYGYDNVTQKFVGSWVDNCGTGIMNGIGELSADGKVMTWNYTFTCPITKKPTVMRQVETNHGQYNKTLEMFGVDPKSGEEYKMMVIEYTRKS